MAVIIDAHTIVPDFNVHIKVSAGPGAGKTRWLINHLINVLNHSDRLSITRKIACITYTNVATDTILNRLGDSAHQVEISTIHSFLYKHVLKPYAHFLEAEFGLNVKLFKGHDDKVLTNYSFIKEWKLRTKQQRINDDDKVKEAFRKIRWEFSAAGQLEAKLPYPIKVGTFSILNSSMMEYKKMAWEKGIVHHDDVLFLSYKLIEKFPFVLRVLRSKFPYFFLDEFQDISPIQMHILKQIALEETTICIVGDNAQSIYGFTGAVAEQFSAFTLPGMVEYEITDNWRSTNKIVTLLNQIRTDLTQVDMRNVTGTAPVIIVGDKMSAWRFANTDCASGNLCVLAYLNTTANAVRKGLTTPFTPDLISELYKTDSNPERPWTIVRCVKAIEYANQGYFKDALKETAKIAAINDEDKSKRQSLIILKMLLDGQSHFSSGKLTDLYAFVKSSGIKSLAGFSGANPKTFYETQNVQDFSAAVRALDESLPFRTIHKSKGDEFDAVLVIIHDDVPGTYVESKELEFLFAPDLSKEDQRVLYVALSRAKNHLYINLPSLTLSSESTLRSMGFRIA